MLCLNCVEPAPQDSLDGGTIPELLKYQEEKCADWECEEPAVGEATSLCEGGGK